MDIYKAILLELFGITLLLFGGFNLLANTLILGDWDVIGDMTVWLWAGVIVGLIGVVAGFQSDE